MKDLSSSQSQSRNKIYGDVKICGKNNFFSDKFYFISEDDKIIFSTNFYISINFILAEMIKFFMEGE